MRRGKEQNQNCRVAIVTEQGKIITYGELLRQMEKYASYFDDQERKLVLVLCDNSYANLCIYLACLWKKIPMVLLDISEQHRIDELIQEYAITYLWMPEQSAHRIQMIPHANNGGYVLYKTLLGMTEAGKVREDIALLLPTSGSEGKSKLVMLSYKNITSNTIAIAEALQIQETDRAAVMLPLCYSYGLSVVHTHLYKKAVLLLPSSSIVRPEFWEFMSKERVTSLAAVPSGYELIRKLKILEGKYDFSNLRIITQAGGALRVDTQKYLLQWSKQSTTNTHVAIMYGQTEATARMTTFFLDEHPDKMGSVGKVIPGGRVWIEGNPPDGSVCYEGKNVFLGYARMQSDLYVSTTKGRQLITGDMGYLDQDGYLYLTGRKSRFAKINGYRVGLDELQAELSEKVGCEILCVTEERQGAECIIICWMESEALEQEIKVVMDSKRKLMGGWRVQHISQIPYKQNGKPDYQFLAESVCR